MKVPHTSMGPSPPSRLFNFSFACFRPGGRSRLAGGTKESSVGSRPPSSPSDGVEDLLGLFACFIASCNDKNFSQCLILSQSEYMEMTCPLYFRSTFDVLVSAANKIKCYTSITSLTFEQGRKKVSTYMFFVGGRHFDYAIRLLQSTLKTSYTLFV
jgi:hypothetical protein